MTLLVLVRHAVADSTGKRLAGQRPGLHLSERGRHQAEALAARLAGVPLAAVYSSPLERCAETAWALARPRGLQVLTVPALSEVHYGRWTGRSIAQLARTKLWTRVIHAPSTVRFPGGESLEEVQRRSVAALSELGARHGGRAVAAVTHAEVIRLALAHFAGVHIDLFQRLVVQPASVSAVAVGGGEPRILRMNDTGRLEDLIPRRPDGRGKDAHRGGRSVTPGTRSDGRRRSLP